MKLARVKLSDDNVKRLLDGKDVEIRLPDLVVEVRVDNPKRWINRSTSTSDMVDDFMRMMRR